MASTMHTNLTFSSMPDYNYTLHNVTGKYFSIGKTSLPVPKYGSCSPISLRNEDPANYRLWICAWIFSAIMIVTPVITILCNYKKYSRVI